MKLYIFYLEWYWIFTPSLTTCLTDHVSQDDSKSSIIDKTILLKYNNIIENQLTVRSFYPLKVYIFYFSFTASI